MNAESACAYCKQGFLAEKMVLRFRSLLLVIHPWCARMLSQDLKESFDGWYTAKYFVKPMAPATK